MPFKTELFTYLEQIAPLVGVDRASSWQAKDRVA